MLRWQVDREQDFGHKGPKGTYDLGLDSHKSIFELLCEGIKKAMFKYEAIIPWYIMTSEENNDHIWDNFIHVIL